MASNLTTYGDISPRTAGFAAKKMLERGQALLVLERFGQFDPQGKNKTLTRKFRRYEPVALATAPLAEGVTPAGQKLTVTDLECVLQQYGDWVQVTDVITDTHEDPVMKEAQSVCGEQIGETVETIRFSVLKGGSNVFYAGSATTRATVNAAPASADFDKIYRAFKRARARELTEIVAASPKISTEPIGKSYFALGHTDLYYDLRQISGFTPIEKYSDPGKGLPGEVGKLRNFRIILSDLFSPWSAAGTSGTTFLANGSAPSASTACDVYPMLFIARDAYGIVPLQGENAVTPMAVSPGKPSPSDPLGQRGFVSWKTYQASIILQDLWLGRLECAATATPS